MARKELRTRLRSSSAKSCPGPGRLVAMAEEVGDRINAVLAAAGYNFGLLLRWLERLLRALLRMLLAAPAPAQNA